jgi:UDP-N-acetylmuramate dehydrogenase
MTPSGDEIRDAARRLQQELRGRVELDCPLAPLTTYSIGGKADLVLLPEDPEDLARGVALLGELGLPWMVLGGGSNVLVSDKGVRGAVVLTVELRQLKVQGSRIVAGAGVASHELALAALAASLSGVEFLTRLPGSLGGACLMNARAFGGEISAVLCRALVVSRAGALGERDLLPEQFSYKRSPFQESGEIVARATLELTPGDAEEIRRRMDHNEARRRDAHEMDHLSCGCVFKNDYDVGTPSGKLIDQCGLKGFRIGDAQVSPHHANFVINLGRATASDVRRVIEHVQRTVARMTGHQLEPEVRMVGEWDE